MAESTINSRLSSSVSIPISTLQLKKELVRELDRAHNAKKQTCGYTQEYMLPRNERPRASSLKVNTRTSLKTHNVISRPMSALQLNKDSIREMDGKYHKGNGIFSTTNSLNSRGGGTTGTNSPENDIRGTVKTNMAYPMATLQLNKEIIREIDRKNLEGKGEGIFHH